MKGPLGKFLQALNFTITELTAIYFSAHSKFLQGLTFAISAPLTKSTKVSTPQKLVHVWYTLEVKFKSRYCFFFFRLREWCTQLFLACFGLFIYRGQFIFFYNADLFVRIAFVLPSSASQGVSE